MPGNSQRRGAVRKTGKGPTVGSGGQRRRGLEGKGPTPKATERDYHPAAKRAKRAGKADDGRTTSGGSGGSGGSARSTTRRSKASSEIVAGRNSVVEALRADIPATTLYLASRIDSDDRVREALKLATSRGLPILETPALGRDDRERLEGLGRSGRPAAGGPRHQPDPGPRRAAEGGLLRARARHGG